MFPMFSLVSISFDPSSLQGAIATPSWDAFLILSFLFATIAYSFFVSRERIAVVLLSVYTSLAIVLATPMITNALATLSADDVYKWRIGIFVGIFLVLYGLLSHRMSLRAEVGHSYLHSFLLSFVQVGLFISSILLLIGPTVYTSDFSINYFSGDIARTFWMIAPLFAMALVRRRAAGPAQ